jgi:hypothetical protein
MAETEKKDEKPEAPKAGEGNTAEGEKGSQGAETKAPEVHLSQDVLLTSLANFKYVHSKKEAKEYSSEKTRRMVKITLLLINILGFCLLILFLLSYFKVSINGNGLKTDVFEWSNFVFFCLVLALDLAYYVIHLIRYFNRLDYFHSGDGVKEEFYFLKDYLAHITYLSKDKDILKDEKVYKYSNIKKIYETKHFFFFELTDGKTVDVYKPGLIIKKMQLDTLRGKIIEASGKKIYISSYIFNPRYDFYFDHALDQSRRDDTAMIMIEIGLFALIPGLFLNFRTGLTLDSIWLFWLAAFLGLAFLITACVYRVEEPKTFRPLFKTELIVFISLLVCAMTLGITSSVYNIYTKFKTRAEEVNALTDPSLRIPTYSTLDFNGTSYAYDPVNGAFRNEEKGKFTDQTEIDAFNTSLPSSPYWMTSEAIWADNAKLQFLPSSSHLEKGQTGIYCTYYSKSLKAFFPSLSSYNVLSLKEVNDEKMYYLYYDISASSMCIVSYNIIAGQSYPIEVL